MSGFASANPWLVLMRNGERSKSSSSEDDSGPLAVTSDTDSEPDEAEEAGSAGPNQEPKKTTASTNRDHSSDGQPKETTNTGTGGDQDHRSEADKQQRLYERVAELSGQALTSDSNSQGIFCDRPQKARETSAGGQTASGERPAQDQQPAAIPEDKSEKLRELQKEFGPIEYSDGSKMDEETYTVDVPASLIIGVMVRGMAFLTNHRLAFYAVLPNLTDEEDAPRDHRLTGTGTIHFSSSLKPKKRAFLVLKSDSINAFSSPRRLDQPWGCIHFSTLKTVKPLDASEDSNWLEFTFISRVGQKAEEATGRCEFDDAVTASRWRNELSAALFQFKNTRDRFRASVPLERIERVDVQAWGDFAQTVSMTVIADGDKRRTLDIGVLSEFSEFVSELVAAVDVVRQRHIGAGAEPASNLPTIEICAPSRNSAQSGTGDLDTSADEADNDHVTSEGEYLPTPRQIERFRFDFGLFGDNEDIYFVAVGSLSKTIPVFGKLAISKKAVMFSRKTAMINNVKIYLPAEDVKDAQETKSLLINSFGLHIVVRGQEDLALLFPTKRRRDAVITAVRSLVEQTQKNSKRESSPVRARASATDASNESRQPQSSLDAWASTIKPAPNSVPLELAPHMPKMVGSNHFAQLPHKTFACLTIGSRGDIQPYIALGKALSEQGHTVYILTHDEYADWIKGHGLLHRPVGGDPGLLMEISVEHKIFDAETQKRFRHWFESLLRDAHKEIRNCNAEVLIESPSAFAGVHIAEALRIPFFRAFSMPWTKTGDFPHAFINGPQTLSRAYNTSTYLLFDQLIWRASSSMINKWRKEELHLAATDLDRIHDKHIVTLYFFSENIVARPLDWPAWVQITGPWVLEKAENDWKPPADLEDFIKTAKKNKKPLVYCGFGSITVNDPVGLTNAVVKSVKDSGVRLILSKGWSGRMQKGGGSQKETEMPPEIYQVDSIPHDWLFPQLDAAMHHGGAGTTSASLSAGCPTLIKPFFGDQYFWANRVQLLGAGLKVKSLDADDLTDAWKTATESRVMKERAEIVGAKLRKEDGVGTAIQLLFSYLSSAQEAMKPKKQSSDHEDTNAPGKGAPNESTTFGNSVTAHRKSVLVPTPDKDGLDRARSDANSRARSGSQASSASSPTSPQKASSNWFTRGRSGTSSSQQGLPNMPRSTSPKSYESNVQ